MTLNTGFVTIIFVLLALLLMPDNALANKFTTPDGLSLDFALSGEGDALVMLHSGMMSRNDMQAQVEYFSAHYQVIALDSREQGRSGSSPEQISYELMSNDVVALLDHLSINKAHLFGQSDGGITALMTAFRHPERVHKLIIHGAVYNYTAYPLEQRERMQNYTWDANNPAHNDPNGFPGMAISSYLLGHPDLSEFEKHLQEMANMWASAPKLAVDDLHTIALPALVIVGDHHDISLSHSVEMFEALPNSQLFVAPGATHYIHQEKPALLHHVMHDFLNASK